jgi:hypothetical protein
MSSRDRNRIDWLQQNNGSIYCNIFDKETGFSVALPSTPFIDGKTVRQAIDKAIRIQKKYAKETTGAK